MEKNQWPLSDCQEQYDEDVVILAGFVDEWTYYYDKNCEGVKALLTKDEGILFSICHDQEMLRTFVADVKDNLENYFPKTDELAELRDNYAAVLRIAEEINESLVDSLQNVYGVWPNPYKSDTDQPELMAEIEAKSKCLKEQRRGMN